MTFDPHSKRGSAPAEVPVGVIVDKSTRVYIKNIPVSRLEKESFDTLKAEFAEFGPLELYVLHKDTWGRFTGTAMATYRNPADAKLAIKKMNGADIDGEALKVNYAKEHGVILANQMHRYDKREEVEEARWTHDKYEMARLGGDEDRPYVPRGRGFGGRGGFRGGDRGSGGDHFRGGRGRGGRGGRGMSSVDRVGASFDQYIAQRDNVVTTTLEWSGGVESAETVAAPQLPLAPPAEVGAGGGIETAE
ncbi:RNA-binding protein, putative [Bodo saltans]|uniref:RNA-binding protein, putative n=1 Tax=Bodo saltans TaxID=75058 RepID=A0A0S4JS65_BODSA|nr:RNA-binding protein, putative [Bodo saltans]|eukprot:CUG93073.1 RNA-binding protein, putative [Bodo saltans]